MQKPESRLLLSVSGYERNCVTELNNNLCLRCISSQIVFRPSLRQLDKEEQHTLRLDLQAPTRKPNNRLTHLLIPTLSQPYL